MPDSTPKNVSGHLQCAQQFIDELTKQLVADLHQACQQKTSPSAKPKSSDMKIDLIYKRAFTTACSGCMFCSLFA